MAEVDIYVLGASNLEEKDFNLSQATNSLCNLKEVIELSLSQVALMKNRCCPWRNFSWENNF